MAWKQADIIKAILATIFLVILTISLAAMVGSGENPGRLPGMIGAALSLFGLTATAMPGAMPRGRK